MKTSIQPKIYQLKVTLKHSKPPIWRRVLVSSNMPLSDIHTVLQIVMGWNNEHLHHFMVEIDKKRTFYGPTSEDDAMGFGLSEEKDERTVKISQILKKVKDSIIYEYDFGDSWVHVIELESILPYDETVELPRCVTGKRACPPEDCGGVSNYSYLLEAFTDPSHPEHQEVTEHINGLYGSVFKPEVFDADKVNRHFTKLKEFIKKHSKIDV